MLSMLSTLRTRLRKNLFKNERGQGATEYILLVAVVVGVVMMFRKNIQSKIEGATEKLGGSIESTVQDSVQ